MSKTQKEYKYRTYCQPKKGQHNFTNNPTAAQLVRPDTPGPPLKVKSRALNLGMQTLGLRYD